MPNDRRRWKESTFVRPVDMTLLGRLPGSTVSSSKNLSKESNDEQEPSPGDLLTPEQEDV